MAKQFKYMTPQERIDSGENPIKAIGGGIMGVIANKVLGDKTGTITELTPEEQNQQFTQKVAQDIGGQIGKPTGSVPILPGVNLSVKNNPADIAARGVTDQQAAAKAIPLIGSLPSIPAHTPGEALAIGSPQRTALPPAQPNFGLSADVVNGTKVAEIGATPQPSNGSVNTVAANPLGIEAPDKFAFLEDGTAMGASKANAARRLGAVPLDFEQNPGKYEAALLATNAADKNAGANVMTAETGRIKGIGELAIDKPYKEGLISNAQLGIEEGARSRIAVAKEIGDARKYAADQKALYEPNKAEKAKIDAAGKREERLIAGRALLMSKPEFSALDDAKQNDLLERLALDSETETWVPGKAGTEAINHWFSKNQPAVPATPGRRVAKAPAGMTAVGMSPAGKTVYKDAQGNLHS